MIVNVPLSALKDDKFLTVELEIPQVTRWAGFTTIREESVPPKRQYGQAVPGSDGGSKPPLKWRFDVVFLV